jgi:hypothetical protein
MPPSVPPPPRTRSAGRLVSGRCASVLSARSAPAYRRRPPRPVDGSAPAAGAPAGCSVSHVARVQYRCGLRRCRVRSHGSTPGLVLQKKAWQRRQHGGGEHGPELMCARTAASMREARSVAPSARHLMARLSGCGSHSCAPVVGLAQSQPGASAATAPWHLRSDTLRITSARRPVAAQICSLAAVHPVAAKRF